MKNNVEDVLYWFSQVGFAYPTDIQRKTFSKIMEHDRDLIVVAPTGSGKTEAVIVPLLVKLSRKGFLNGNSSIAMIYITPLRALNRDIKSRLENICAVFGCSVDVWHGDTSYGIRKRIMKNPPNILLTTPESFQILLIKNDLKKHLANLYAVIVDELQEIINDERGVELFLSLERLDEMLSRHIRRIALSASINEFDVNYIGNIIFSHRSFDVALSKTQKIYDVTVGLTDKSYQGGIFSTEKVVDKIAEVADSALYRQVLVFTNTRTAAEELGFMLRMNKKLSENVVGLHHGSLSRIEREYVEKNFKSGSLKLVVATSSLELGIDIGTVDYVIQYLSPRQVTKLMQRVGRAGHREEGISKGIILNPPIISEIVESLIIAKRLQRGDLERIEMHFNSLDVLAHQFVGMAIERDSIDIDDFFRLVKKSPLFEDITLDNIEEIISFLNEIGLVKCTDNGNSMRCQSTKRGYIYYVTTNMIPDTTRYLAKSIIDHKVVASLDEDFIATCNEGDIIVLAGRPWKVISVEFDEKTVWLAPYTELAEIVLPRWVGENIPVDRKVSREVCSFLRRFCTCNEPSCIEHLLSLYNVDKDLKEFLLANREAICKVYPNDRVLTIELLRIPNENKTLLAIYTCLGSKASEAFSILISKILREYLRIGNTYKSHQLGTVVLIDSPINVNDVKRVLSTLLDIHEKGLIRDFIVEELKKTSIFKRNLINVARKMGIISKNSDIKEIKRIVSSLMATPILVNETVRELLVEKIDIEEVGKFIDSMKRGLKIRIIVVKKPSPFLQEITQLGSLRYIIRSSALSKELILELAKRRLLNKSVKAFCMICNKLFEININAHLDNICKTDNPFKCPISCPFCGSKAITVVENDDEVNVLRKAISKARNVAELDKLNIEERKVLEKSAEIANMLMEYGLAFLIALQGIGIGIENSKKVLSKAFDMNTLIQNILEYEERFLRTRKYWD
ncbi:MAG: DEAD/DEAH box helicase [Ignisphaera sp.]